jgi:hypothetical protein
MDEKSIIEQPNEKESTFGKQKEEKLIEENYKE